MNLATEKGALAYAERMKDEMRRSFERIGRFEENGFSFAARLFATHDIDTGKNPADVPRWKTGKKLDQVEVFPCRLPRGLPTEDFRRLRDIFATVVREHAKITRAIGVIFMAEIWYAQAPKETVKDEASAQRWRAEQPENMADVPGRGEMLLCRLEHQALGARGWSAQIERNPTRLAPWETLDWTGVAGRMINLVEGWRS